MNIKVLKTEEDYNNAISMLEALGDEKDFEESQELQSQFELLTTLIEMYEKEHAPIVEGHPIDIILLKMEYMNLKQKDLIPHIGSSGVISEVLNKKRALSKKMIRSFSELLKLDQNILNTHYDIIETKAIKKSTPENKTASNKNNIIIFKYADTSRLRKYKEHVIKSHTLIAFG